MKRRLLLATLGATALAGCQSSGGADNSEQPLQKLDVTVTNRSDQKDLFNLVVVTESYTVNRMEIALAPGEQKPGGHWEGQAFTVFGISDTFGNFTVVPIGTRSVSNTYKKNIVIEKSGELKIVIPE